MKKLFLFPWVLLVLSCTHSKMTEPTEPWLSGSDLFGPVRIVQNLDSLRPAEDFRWQKYAPDGSKLIMAVRPVDLDTMIYKYQKLKDGSEREILQLVDEDSTIYIVSRHMTYGDLHRLQNATVKYRIQRLGEIAETSEVYEYQYLETDSHGNWTKRMRIGRDPISQRENTAIEEREIFYWD